MDWTGKSAGRNAQSKLEMERGCIPPQSKLNTVEAMDMARAYRCKEGPVTFQVRDAQNT